MADEALEHSRETRHLLNNHIQITQIELRNLDKAGQDRHDALVAAGDARHITVVDSVKKLESALKWAGGLVVTIMLSVMAWALGQQVSANESQKKDMEQQIKLLQEQERARVQTRSEILTGQEAIRESLSPSGAAETTPRAGGAAQR